MDSQTPEEDKKNTARGRARERQRRRKERQQQTQPSSSTPRAAQHLSATDRLRFNLSGIDLARLRLVAYGVGGAVLIVAIVLLLGQLAREDEVPILPNAVWIGTEWTYAVHEQEAVDALVTRLQDHDIGTIYAWISWLQEDETWRGAENFGAVRAFAEQFKATYPTSNLYGWLSLPVNMGENNYRLDNEDIQQNIADFSARVVSELGFDGIFLNIEPVWDGDENFLSLLRKVRVAMPESAPLSVAVPPDWSPTDATIPVPPLIVPGTEWARTYKQSVALLADELAVMAYNSGLSSPDDYTEWMAYQVNTFTEAISELGAGTQIMIGIPTYDAEPPGHDPAVENIVSAVEGVNAGLVAAGENAVFVTGLAIYADWTTDETEWADFRSAWIGP